MEAVHQLYFGPTIRLQVAPSLLAAVPFLPLAFAVGASVVNQLLRWPRAGPGQDYFSVFIQESDIIAGLELEGDGEEELTPAHLEALLPAPPILLLVVPLGEAMAWTGIAAERLARLGWKLDWTLGADLALASVWVSRAIGRV